VKIRVQATGRSVMRSVTCCESEVAAAEQSKVPQIQGRPIEGAFMAFSMPSAKVFRAVS